MACHASNYLKTTFLFIILFVFGFRENLAMRPLEGEKWMNTNRVLAAQILQKGSVPSSHGNPCTNIPGGKPGRRCTLAENEVNFSGQVDHSSVAFPDVMVKFAPAIANAPNDKARERQAKSS